MDKVISNRDTFYNRNMCQTFYPTLGEIKTNNNKSFKINKALVIKKKAIQENSPFYIHFGDLRINAGNRHHRTKGNKMALL